MEHLAAKAIKQSVAWRRGSGPDHIYSKLWTAVWVALELFYANGGYIVYFNRVIKVPLLRDIWRCAPTSQPPVRLWQDNQLPILILLVCEIHFNVRFNGYEAAEFETKKVWSLVLFGRCCSTGQTEKSWKPIIFKSFNIKSLYSGIISKKEITMIILSITVFSIQIVGGTILWSQFDTKSDNYTSVAATEDI